MMQRQSSLESGQRGGTILGFILGLLVGLGAALGVAMYVTNVPVPFLNRAGTRDSSQNVQEAEHNRDWDPNASMQGRSARPNSHTGPVTPAATPSTTPATTSSSAATTTPLATSTRGVPTTPVASGAQQSASTSTPATATKPVTPPAVAVSPSRAGDPLGELVASRAASSASAPAPAPSADGFEYFVQAGAFSSQADADAQRARLAILGWQARISEREQSGKTVFRVRVGPFDKRDQAEQLKDNLAQTKVDSTLVRVQR